MVDWLPPVILGLWGLVVLLASVGIVRHMRLRRDAIRDVAKIRSKGLNGYLLLAATTLVRAETFRATLKTFFLAGAVLSLNARASRADATGAYWDWQDLLGVLLALLMVLWLTWWSELDAHQRPAKRAEQLARSMDAVPTSDPSATTEPGSDPDNDPGEPRDEPPGRSVGGPPP